MSDCINLREQFGERFAIDYDPAHRGRGDDPWLQIIPCQRGHHKGEAAKAVNRLPKRA